MVGGGTGRAYELLERVSELPRDQRFRQIYPATGAAGSALPNSRPGDGSGLSLDRVHEAVHRKADGGQVAEAHRGGRISRQRPEERGTPTPSAQLRALRRSLATALTQLWPWGRGPQAPPDSAATCPAHLDGGEWERRRLAPAHTELAKVRNSLHVWLRAT